MGVVNRPRASFCMESFDALHPESLFERSEYLLDGEAVGRTHGRCRLTSNPPDKERGPGLEDASELLGVLTESVPGQVVYAADVRGHSETGPGERQGERVADPERRAYSRPARASFGRRYGTRSNIDARCAEPVARQPDHIRTGAAPYVERGARGSYPPFAHRSCDPAIGPGVKPRMFSKWSVFVRSRPPPTVLGGNTLKPATGSHAAWSDRISNIPRISPSAPERPARVSSHLCHQLQVV
jgi:hypothetical protein